MGNQSARLLEAAGNYTGFDNGKSHHGVWMKEKLEGGKAAVRTGPE